MEKSYNKLIIAITSLIFLFSVTICYGQSSKDSLKQLPRVNCEASYDCVVKMYSDSLKKSLQNGKAVDYFFSKEIEKIKDNYFITHADSYTFRYDLIGTLNCHETNKVKKYLEMKDQKILSIKDKATLKKKYPVYSRNCFHLKECS